jgi:hypothetical protein
LGSDDPSKVAGAYVVQLGVSCATKIFHKNTHFIQRILRDAKLNPIGKPNFLLKPRIFLV